MRKRRRHTADQLWRAGVTGLRIVDPETDTECPAGTTGEIWVHGDNVAKGYWGKRQETEQTFRGTVGRAFGGHT